MHYFWALTESENSIRFDPFILIEIIKKHFCRFYYEMREMFLKFNYISVLSFKMKCECLSTQLMINLFSFLFRRVFAKTEDRERERGRERGRDGERECVKKCIPTIITRNQNQFIVKIFCSSDGNQLYFSLFCKTFGGKSLILD